MANLSTGACFLKRHRRDPLELLLWQAGRTWVQHILKFVCPLSSTFCPIFRFVGWNYLPYYLKPTCHSSYYCNTWLWAPCFLAGLETLAPITWDVTEVKTVHFPSKSEEVLICWVKALLEARGQSVIGASAWIWNSDDHDVDSHLVWYV